MTTLSKTRLEAFSDGVIAIILTIMVLDLKVPPEHTVEALKALWPVYISYCLSYLFVFLVWLNHHDTFASLEAINRPVLIANGLLLFASSLIPFATAFAGEAHWHASVPVITYGLVMVAVSLAFAWLRTVASRCALDSADVAVQRAQARKSLHLAATFFIGACAGALLPRLGLLAFALTPLVHMVYHRIFSRRRRHDTRS